VIAQWVNYGDLLKWAKLKDVVIKTGEFKDTGNPARDLTPAELRKVRDYERRRGNRKSVLDAIEGKLS